MEVLFDSLLAGGVHREQRDLHTNDAPNLYWMLEKYTSRLPQCDSELECSVCAKDCSKKFLSSSTLTRLLMLYSIYSVFYI